MHTAQIITDLTFGDAGKGTLTDALVRRSSQPVPPLVVRYNGGAQAAHTVIDASGRHHAFHQFGSGTFVEGAETLLSRFVLVNPIALWDEAMALESLGVADALTKVYVDTRALVTTPYHTILNQLRELARGAARHGSCGLGIGETASDALAFGDNVLRWGDLRDSAYLWQKLFWHREVKQRQSDELLPALECLPRAEWQQATTRLDRLHSDDELTAAVEVFGTVADVVQTAHADFLERRLRQPGTTVFEGAQGVLLDESWGFHPYTTWSTTTPANALTLIRETGADVETTVLGVTRAYQTRHGAGPFPTESIEIAQALPEPHNPTNDWQGPFRAGWLDLALLRYAIAACGGLDGLIVTCLDRIEALADVRVGVGYSLEGRPWELLAEGAGDLARRESEGGTLNRVTVQQESVALRGMAFAEWIAAQVDVPLKGASFGATAEDKLFL